MKEGKGANGERRAGRRRGGEGGRHRAFFVVRTPTVFAIAPSRPLLASLKPLIPPLTPPLMPLPMPFATWSAILCRAWAESAQAATASVQRDRVP